VIETKKMQFVKWCLENTSDPVNKWVFPIDPVPFTIGRNEDCNLTLKSKGVSRHHAQINVSGNMLWIRDSGSTNGTLLNGKPIAESEALNNGDVLQIGQVTFLNMSQDLGVTTIAEGIECREEGETCRQLGFDYAQGYFYGTPIPISKFGLAE
jgi:hypothetical protein